MPAPPPPRRRDDRWLTHAILITTLGLALLTFTAPRTTCSFPTPESQP